MFGYRRNDDGYARRIVGALFEDGVALALGSFFLLEEESSLIVGGKRPLSREGMVD